jgi:sugar O-acyltransferase (sialic acid O-acetyltransferase NeuD family)
VVCFVDDKPETWDSTLNQIPVRSVEEAQRRYPDASCTIAVGSPNAREGIEKRLHQLRLVPVNLIHPRVEKSRWLTIGEGAIICAGSILTTNITVGRHVHINLDCTIGHDVVLGDFVTLAPGVHVSGAVHIGRRVNVGTGAVFINGSREKPMVIGDDAIVGAGACVIKDVDPGVTVVGVPARPLIRS